MNMSTTPRFIWKYHSSAFATATLKVVDPLGLNLKAGDSHYRAYVGPPGDYDRIAAMTFNLLTAVGLRQQHKVLDIGCGSLRVGRLLIPYLNKGNCLRVGF